MTLLYVLAAVLAFRLVCAGLAAATGAGNAFEWKRTFRRSPTDPPYMVRRQLLRSPWVDLYLNQILTPDYDPDPHNHPWKRCYSFKLAGSYIERIYSGPGLIFEHWRVPRRWSRVPNIHRIEEVVDGPAWTLFVGIGRHKVWGFFEMPGGRFVRHDERGEPTQRSLGVDRAWPSRRAGVRRVRRYRDTPGLCWRLPGGSRRALRGVRVPGLGRARRGRRAWWWTDESGEP